MCDYIKMQKLWQDNELMQLKVQCLSTVITAVTKIYVSDSLIDDLFYQITQFLNGIVKESYWANETKGNDSTACVSFRFINKDKLGHILIEVFMELDDGGDYSNHNCCFFVNTETGLLEKFKNQLIQLKRQQSGFEVVLNKTCDG